MAFAGIGLSDELPPTRQVWHGGPETRLPSALRYVGRVADGDRNAAGEPVEIRNPGDLALHGAGGALYLASETGLAVFSRTPETGRLDHLRTLAGTVDLRYASVVWDAPRNRLLADDCGRWRSFAADDVGVGLAPPVALGAKDDPGTCGDALLADAQGGFIYRVGPGRVDAFAVDPAGELRFAQAVEASGLSAATLGPGGRVYAAAVDGLIMFDRDPASGLLNYRPGPRLVRSARALAVAGDGTHLFALDADGGRISVFALDPDGEPRPAPVSIPLPASSACRFVAARPTAPTADVLCGGGAFAVRVRAVVGEPQAAAAAAAALPEHPRTASLFNVPEAMAASPDGRHVYVAVPGEGVLIYARDGDASAYTETATGDGDPRAVRRGFPGFGERFATQTQSATGPDLWLEKAEAGSDFFIRLHYALSVAVRNGGDRESAATTLRLYRSEIRRVADDDEEVGAEDVDALAPDETVRKYIGFVPQDTGAYYYACIDAVDGEADADNNCSALVWVAARETESVVPTGYPQAKAFALFRNDPTGIAHAGGTLYVVNNATDQVHAYSADGHRKPGWDFDLDGSNGWPIAIAHADGTLYVADGWDDKVYAYGTDGGRRPGSDFDLDFDFSRGIAHADGTLYVADELDDKVYAYGSDGGRRPGSDFDLDGDNGWPIAIAHADGTLYVVDRGDLKVYAYGTDGERRPGSDFDLGGNNVDPADIAHADGTLYVVDRGDHGTDYKIYAYGTNGWRRPGSDFELDGDNWFPQGIAHAGGTLHVVQDWDDKVYAYGTDGGRLPGSDFELDGDNVRPGGIAHAGGTLYVADASENKVYAYGTDGGRLPGSDFDLDGDPGGIAHADGTLYVIVGDKVYAYGTDGGRLPGSDFELDGDNGRPEGIAHAGGTLYVADASDDKVYAYGTDGGRRAGSDFELDRETWDQGGIAYADGTFYVVSRGGLLHVYRDHGPDGGRRAGSDFELDGDNGRPAGIAHADGTLYVADASDDKVYAYGTDGGRRPVSDFDLDGDNFSPGGIAHADGTLHVVDDWQNKVYAYGTDGGRRPGSDLELDGDNGRPEGIAHADGTLYVADSRDNKVYAYGTDGGRRPGSDFDLARGNSRPDRMGHADGTLYVADGSDVKLYAYGTDGTRRPGGDIDPVMGLPTGVTDSDGTLYAIEGLYVYAYRLAHDPDATGQAPSPVATRKTTAASEPAPGGAGR